MSVTTTTPPDFTEQCDKCGCEYVQVGKVFTVNLNCDCDCHKHPATDLHEQTRQLVERCVMDASRVPCDCEDLWCVHWKDEVSKRIASFAAEAATQGQVVGIERAEQVVNDYFNLKQKQWYEKYGRVGIYTAIRALSPDPSFPDRVRTEAATAERERIQKAVGLLPLHVREIPGSPTAQSLYLAEDVFAAIGNDKEDQP